jgi:hypothetical protein
MVGAALLIAICAVAIWASYEVTRLFPALRNKTCKNIAIAVPVLLALLLIFCTMHDPLLGGPIQMLSETSGKELLGIFLGLLAVLTFPTIALIFWAGCLLMSAANRARPR